MSTLKSDVALAPPQQVVLLPDEAFFVRNVPLVLGRDASDIASQVELALESLAPFPLSQMYFGYWTKPGVDHALVFGAYRRRFSDQDVESWAGAEWVTPRFAALLAGPAPAPGTSWLIESPESLTAIYFGDGTGVPTLVRVESLAGATEPSGRAAVRDRLLRGLPGSRTVVEIAAIDVPPHGPGENEWEVRAGSIEAEVNLAQAEQLDVRDKSELGALRRARTRDRWLWRGLLLGVGILAACALLELGLVGLRTWDARRLEQVALQTPVVTEITTAHALAARIEELSSRRLRPFEMIAHVDGPRPDTIQFLNTTTNGLYTLDVQAQTTSLSDLNQYRTAIAALPGTRDVKIEVQGTRSNMTTFRLTVTFNPDAFAPTVEVSS